MADPMLSFGSTGSSVSALQSNLLRAGFDPKGVDGKFGKNTLSALKGYQQANGLESKSGIAGPQTWGSFFNRDTFTPAAASRGTTPVSRSSASARSVLPTQQTATIQSAATPGVVPAHQAAAVRVSLPPTSGRFYAQADPRYSSYNIGNPNSHLGNAGCGPTSIANALGMTPVQVVDKIRAAGGFSRSELSSFDNAKGMAAVGGRLVTSFSAKDLANQVDSGKPVVLGVQHDGGQGHYVTLLANGRNGNTFQAVDPAGAKLFTMTANKDGTLTGTGWRDYVSRQKAVFFN
jgi:peptidoglycan hydrolase-like protein with peptidoglycan-binding domain